VLDEELLVLVGLQDARFLVDQSQVGEGDDAGADGQRLGAGIVGADEASGYRDLCYRLEEVEGPLEAMVRRSFSRIAATVTV
jgi:hypothetical protein